MSIQQPLEVPILAHENCLRFPRGKEDLLIFCVPQSQSSNGSGLYVSEGTIDPGSYGW